MTLPISREHAQRLARSDGKSLRVLCALKNLVVDSTKTKELAEKSKQTHAVHYASLRSVTRLSNNDIDKAIDELIKMKVLFDDGIEWHSCEKRDAFNYKWNFVLVKD